MIRGTPRRAWLRSRAEPAAADFRRNFGNSRDDPGDRRARRIRLTESRSANPRHVTVSVARGRMRGDGDCRRSLCAFLRSRRQRGQGRVAVRNGVRLCFVGGRRSARLAPDQRRQDTGGEAAAGLALSLIIWGFATGILVPFVHRPLHESLETASKSAEVGPNAAAAKNGPIHEQRRSTTR